MHNIYKVFWGGSETKSSLYKTNTPASKNSKVLYSKTFEN